ncbi:McrC family protein [Citrobacter freundii]|uniref:McrC family protein n=1 Tax=Citrobacter freundii TaxID=546 RepID=UPI0015E9EFF7|nr:McrC family protein [Citrobacter freundii]QLY53841.1 McrC family protein [Citrobacter freundii]
MKGIVIHEFETLIAESTTVIGSPSVHQVPEDVFNWLEKQALRISEAEKSLWIRLTQRLGRRAVQVKSFVGVIRAPDGYQIEVLPKIGKATSKEDARKLLIEMLSCLGPFRHIQTDNATLLSRKMPLLEIFISEFLNSVKYIVKRGIRSDYHAHEDNLFALRGKIQISTHMQVNICRRDRFFTEYDEFSSNRPENRLIHAALKCVIDWTNSQQNQQMARELSFTFSDVPSSKSASSDFAKVRLDRGMAYYDAGLAWARLILNEKSPLTGSGKNSAPSLLFPMEAVYEAFVSRHLSYQFAKPYKLKMQANSISLVSHLNQGWFRLKPDMLLQSFRVNHIVFDTKWKLIDSKKDNGSEKYGLSQGDFYQLHAYGQNYLDGTGDVVLIYPKTDHFDKPLPVFDFPKSSNLRLWVLPFCLKEKRLLLPPCQEFISYFNELPDNG